MLATRIGEGTTSLQANKTGYGPDITALLHHLQCSLLNTPMRENGRKNLYDSDRFEDEAHAPFRNHAESIPCVFDCSFSLYIQREKEREKITRTRRSSLVPRELSEGVAYIRRNDEDS